MNKVKNKIMSAAAVVCIINIVLCLMLPLFEVIASAEETIEKEVVYPPYYGIEYFEPHEDGSGFKLLADDISSSSGCLLPFFNHLTDYITEDEYKANWRRKVGSSYYDLPPYYGIKYTSGYRIINANDDYYQFVSCLDYAHSYADTKINYTAEQEYYYFTFFITYKSDNPYRNEIGMYDRCFTFISETPFKVAKNGDGNYYLTGSEMYYMVAVAQTIYHEDDNYYSVSFSNGAIRENKYLFDSNMNYVTSVSTDEDNYDYQCSKFYTNCTTMDLSMFNNTDNLAYGISDLKQTKPSLSEQIDVKLTPEFGLDMDRTFDPLTGQNDYFKFEITNNSETNVQFCAYINDGQFNDLYDDTEHGGASGSWGEDTTDEIIYFNANGYSLIEQSHWNYITDTSYYVSTYSHEKELLIMHDYTFTAELQKGNFYWVLLKSGETYSDYIYWENVNIVPFKEYTFVIQAIPTNLTYPSNIFYYMNGDEKQYRYVLEVMEEKDETFTNDDFIIKDSYKDYSLHEEDICTPFHQTFSVTSIPDFTTTIKGGNSKITSGWGDTTVQANNPYYRYDMDNGELKAVNGYSEFKGSLSDVNVDIDNVGVNDIKEYITYSQDYFALIKNVFQMFPALWVLIVFGLGAIIAIAIIRYIRG